MEVDDLIESVGPLTVKPKSTLQVTPSRMSEQERYIPQCLAGWSDVPTSSQVQLQRMRHGRSYTFRHDLFTLNKNHALWQRDLREHTGCVNAVEFNRNETLFASGGDDRRVVVWRVADAMSSPDPGSPRPKPIAIMQKKHLANIFTLQFNHDGTQVLSAGNDECFHVHDIKTGSLIQTYKAGIFYSLSVNHENDNIVAAATEDNRIYLYDLRMSPHDPVTSYHQEGENYCVNFNHISKDLLATCNKDKGLSVIDIRAPDNFYVSAGPVTNGSSWASWNAAGDGLFCIRANKYPVYYNVNRAAPIVCTEPSYSNNITIKSCQMIGNNYAITGSDKWDIYCWKVPHDYDPPIGVSLVRHPMTNGAHTILKGHQSIVNHVRYSDRNNILLSCGVEKTVKMWSGHRLPDSRQNPPRRVPYTEHPGFLDYDSPSDDDGMSMSQATLRIFDHYLVEEATDPYPVTEAVWGRPSSPPVRTSEVPRRRGRLEDIITNNLRMDADDLAMLRHVQQVYSQFDVASDDDPIFVNIVGPHGDASNDSDSDGVVEVDPPYGHRVLDLLDAVPDSDDDDNEDDPEESPHRDNEASNSSPEPNE
uniref:WD_REPEATS_REGION domain-containing protein n=1 Tax=Panagrellus redivivus TaxID=6233 RepID=A0A7E4UMW4_PANRE